MSDLKNLLEGVKVEWKTIVDYIDYIQPTKYLVKSKNYNNDDKTPVLTAGKTFVLGYTDETDGIYKASISPVIIFDDFTTANKWVDFDFKAKSSAMKILTPKDESKISLKYFFYILNTIPSELVEGDHKRQWISNYANKEIPIPCPDNPEKSLQIQEEIVHLLDTYTALYENLEIELRKEFEVRKKHFEYYRHKLLTINKKTITTKKITFGDIYDFQYGTGNTIPKNGGEFPVYGSNGIVGSHTEYNSEDAPVIGHIGAYAGIVNWGKGKHFVTYNGVICKLKNKDVLPQYAYYLLLLQNFGSKSKSASQPFVSYNILKEPEVLIPPIEEQERIVAILEKFNRLTNAISEELSKELELRRKQYNYYRERLLSFQILQAESY